MKLLFNLMFILGVTVVCAQNSSSQILKLMKTQEAAWNSGDLEAFMQQYWKNDSLRFIGKSGITYGWQKTLDNYKKGYPDKSAMGQLTFEIVRVEELSDTSAYVIGKWSLVKEKPAGGYFTLMWKKINGEWVIVADHTS